MPIPEECGAPLLGSYFAICREPRGHEGGHVFRPLEVDNSPPPPSRDWKQDASWLAILLTASFMAVMGEALSGAMLLMFREVLEISRKDIPKEYDSDWIGDFDLDAYLDNVLHLMRRGFRKAERRFGTGCAGYSLFYAIKDAVKPCRPEYVGQEFVLRYGNGQAFCHEVYDREDW